MFSVKSIPNCITCVRILGAILLLILRPFTLTFYIIYGICGVTDAIDGYLARKLNAGSAAGAVLDSIADLLFYAAMLYRMIPYLWSRVPMLTWYCVGAVLVIRLAAYLAAAFKYHRFASLHTYGNKATGAGMFLLPYLVLLLNDTLVCAALCVVGGLASLEELIIHLRLRTYCKDVKSLFMLKAHRDAC